MSDGVVQREKRSSLVDQYIELPVDYLDIAGHGVKRGLLRHIHDYPTELDHQLRSVVDYTNLRDNTTHKIPGGGGSF